MALYNGYRDKLDTEKAIYRLSTLGIIDDYTVNFSTSTFNLIGTKKSEKEYKEILRKYLCKYYSEKTSDIRLKTLSKIDEPTPVRKYLNFLVSFVYTEIQKKRKLAMHDMKAACRLGLEKGSVELKDFIDLYFNSKYARSGYSYQNEKGKEILASLPDLTNNGKNDDLNWVWSFIDYVEEDPKAGQIDNIKHLRGACIRMLSNQPDSYTLLLLNAFTLYMLEFKNPRYLQEAEGLLLHAFSQIEDKESNLTDSKLEEIYDQFTELMLEKNPELATQMKKHGFEFDFDSIMIKRYLQPLKNAKNTLVKLNEILN
jgi:ATP-dependent DNA helicase RecQ